MADRFTRHLATALTHAFVCTAVCAQPITAERIEHSTDAGDIRGWVATVDLADPRIETLVGVSPSSLGRVSLTSTREWVASEDADIGINANFFGTSGEAEAVVVGLCIADSDLVGRDRRHEGVIDPALVVFEDHAVIGRLSASAATGAVAAVAGVGGSLTSDIAGTLLVDDGIALGTTARVQPLVRHPRTAAGVTQDGRTLIMMVIDGRQEDWSIGVTLPELSALLIEHGAWDALNLDGGGSSSFVFADEHTGELHTNRPSDGDFRPVAVSLGFRLNDDTDAFGSALVTQDERDTRASRTYRGEDP